MRKQFSAPRPKAPPLAALRPAALLGASVLAGACLLAGCTGTGSGGQGSTGPGSAGSSSAGSSSAGSSGAGAGSAAAGAGTGSGGTASSGTGPGGTGPGGTAPAGTAPATTAPSAAGPAAALLAAAIGALHSGGAVHIDITDQTPQGTITYSDEATADGGRQLISTSDGGRITILYIAGTAYVTGNSAGLVNFMGVPANEATGLVDRWVAVRSGQSLGQNSYTDIAAGITLSSVATELQVGSPLTLTAPTTVDGQRVIGVQGSGPASQQSPQPARATLYVMAIGTPRPVLYTTSAGGDQTRTAFSRWGETVPLTAPQGAISAASLGPPILT